MCASKKIIFGSEYCNDNCGEFVLLCAGSEGLAIVGQYEDGDVHDFSVTPLRIFSARMNIGDSIVSSVPAGVIDPDEIKLTATLLGVQTVVTPAGTFTDALVLQAVLQDSPTTDYTEILWIAKRVGPVKILRLSETPENGNDGCIFSCFSVAADTGVGDRDAFFEGFFSQKNKVIVIPLRGD